jgi:hypothetical protein
VAFALLPLSVGAAPRGQECRFVLGFQALHDLIPAIVGDCVTDEVHNPVNGDALHETTTGLLVWRQADNWTAFTDGNRTWIVGPFGLQSRLNEECFEWESDTVCAGPRVTPSGLLGGNILTVSSPRGPSGWIDPASALPDDVVALRVVVLNVSTTAVATNVVALVNLPTDLSVAPAPSVTVSADNAGAVGDTAVVNVLGGSQQGLRYLTGQTLFYSDACPDGCPLAETVDGSAITLALGSLGPGEAVQIVVRAQMTNFVAVDLAP